MMKFQTRRIALAGSLAIAFGCSDNKSMPTGVMSGKDTSISSTTLLSGVPTKVTLTPSLTMELAPDAGTQLAAAVTDSLGRQALSTLLWTSSNSAIANVGDGGFVNATAIGTTVITAMVRSNHLLIDSILVTVRMTVKTVAVALSSSSIAVGSTSQATATLKDSLGQVLTGRTVKWTSTTPAVATVDSITGRVTGVAVGTSTITATNMIVSGFSVTGSATITVTAAPPAPPMPIKTITVALGSATIASSATTQATATLKDSLGQVLTGRTVTWSSSNAAVATVNAATGVVTGLAAGTSSINATSGSVTGNAQITVTGTAPAAGAETLANLPQVYLNTAMPAAPAAGGTIINVPAGGNLQTALNNAQPGDVIQLANGATFSGNFVLPNKNTTSTKWIVIRPASMAGVPLEGSRMTPTLAAAAHLPIIMSTSNQGAFNTATGAHHYRLVALEVSVPATISNTGLVRFGSGYETTMAQLPHDLVIDRMYIHGTATGALRRAVVLNSASSAIVDSYISECHEKGTDSQALGGWNGSGPFKIVNNYLEGASENIMFGGADPVIPGLIPSDIEIRHNHITKQLSWKGQGWVVKNLLELKNAQRVLVEGNLLENNWQDAQGGSAVNLKSVNQDGTCPWCITRDVTMRLNLIRNTGSGLNLSGADPQPLGQPQPMERVTITDNIIDGINQGAFLGDGRGVMVNSNPIDLTMSHNTIMEPSNMAIAFGGPVTAVPVRFTYRDNVTSGGAYGVKGPGLSAANTFATFMTPGRFLGNVIIYAYPTDFPVGNYVPATRSAIGFVSTTDLHLAVGSSYVGKATDARDPGANVNAVNAAIAGVIVP